MNYICLGCAYCAPFLPASRKGGIQKHQIFSLTAEQMVFLSYETFQAIYWKLKESLDNLGYTGDPVYGAWSYSDHMIRFMNEWNKAHSHFRLPEFPCAENQEDAQ